jgi:hypothetical protein
MTKEIIIAAYDKDLGWLERLNPNIKKTIYRKGTKGEENELFIEPNLGRCVHSFFYHLYNNYDELADISFFVQDYPFDHWGNVIEVVNSDEDFEKTASLTINGYYGYHNNNLGTAWVMLPSKHFETGFVLTCSSNGHPQDTIHGINVDKYWEMLFDEHTLDTYEFIPGGHFAITKEHVRLRSKEFYKKVIDLLIEDNIAPWVFERLECYIFNPKHKTLL